MLVLGHWKKKKKQGAKVVSEQMKQSDLRNALRSRYTPVANDKWFEELLARLEEPERYRNKH